MSSPPLSDDQRTAVWAFLTQRRARLESAPGKDPNFDATAIMCAPAQFVKAPHSAQVLEKNDAGAGSSSATVTTIRLCDDPAKTAYTHFALSLFKASAVHANYVVCPASLGAILALLMEGAMGTTKRQIVDILAQGAPDTTSSFYSNLMSSISAQSDRGVIARMMNAVLVDEKYTVLESYKERIEKLFKAIVTRHNLTNGEESSKEVNDLIVKATNNRFPALTSAESFTASTKFLLVNTITFEGEWKQKFEQSLTDPEIFYGLNSNRTEQFMYEQQHTAPHSITAELKVVELLYNVPLYKEPTWSLFLIMPTGGVEDANGVPANVYKDWLKALTAEQLTSAMQGVKSVDQGEHFELTMPKYSLEIDLSFEGILKRYGVHDCFASTADLSAMTEEHGICVQSVQQKVTFSVDEDGTKAGAETAGCGILMGDSERIRFDRPFMYILAKDKLPTFIGHFI